MNILVIGSGGREHAICWAFAKSDRVGKIYCAPGNAGIAELAECVAIKAEDIDGLADFAGENAIDLTFVGGETPLALGIADEFEARGLKIIGASKKAARLEASKAFAKDFMKRRRVPTAEYSVARSVDEAISLLESGRFGGAEAPVVVKADGLAAGKGVVVAADQAKAIAAIKDLANLVGAEASSQIVLEEFLVGREVSLILFADGENFALMPPARDHKRIGEGDTGPNTGGMGTFTDESLLNEEQTGEIIETIIKPTLRGCTAEGFPFRGILFLGLMMTGDEIAMRKPARERGRNAQRVDYAVGHARASAIAPKLLEYNVRFGDPETQSILVRLETDMVEICEAMLNGRLDKIDINWRPGSSATIVLAAKGYPQAPRKGDLMSGLHEAANISGVTLFHAGTSASVEGRAAAAADGGSTSHRDFLTAGGRVLGVTAVADSLRDSLDVAYSAVEKIKWSGMQFRRDIGK